MNDSNDIDRDDPMNDNDTVHEDDSFEDDELLQRMAEPPELPAAGAEQIERTWEAIEAHLEATKVVALPLVPAWSRQLVRVAAVLVMGFGAAWFAAERGWLPLTVPQPVATGPEDSVDSEPNRVWLAGSDYGDRLEALLLGLSRGGSDTIGDVAPAAREVSRELLNDNRFYQRVAKRNDDAALSDLLARVEIILLTLATAPEGQEQDAVNALRQYMNDSDLLSEIRDVQASVPKMPLARPTSGS